MKDFNIENHGGELRISWRWQRGSGWFLIFFGMFWTTLSAFIGIGTLALVPLLFILIGVFVTYLGIANQVNSTTLHVNHRQIEVDHAPLPWFGSNIHAVQDLEQLYVMESGHEKVGNRTTTMYAVKAKTKHGDTVVLVNGIADQEKALLIERTIEDYLNIRDEAVQHTLPPRLEAFLKKFPEFDAAQLPQPINEGKPTVQPGGSQLAQSSPKLIPGSAEHDAYALRRGDSLKLLHEEFGVLHHYQYDWADGRSDVGYLLQNEANATNLYAEQAGNKYLYFEERPLLPEEAKNLGFEDLDEVPNTFKNVDDKFYHRNEVIGVRHLDHGQESVHCRQWVYFATTTRERFRVLRIGQLLKVFIQEPISVDNIRIREELKASKKRNS